MLSKNKWLISALVCLLLLVALLPSYSQAQDNLRVISSGAEASFPDSLTFKIQVSGAFPITKIYLRYRLLNDNPIKVFSEVWLNFRPDNSVNTSWEWQMKKTGGLPPFTVLSYWWIITDEKGNRIETPPRDFIYFDTRYNWKPPKVRGNIMFFWVRGDDNFAGEMLSASVQALDRLEKSAGIKVGRQIKLFIYPSPADLRQAILYTSEWTGGVAFTDFGVVAVGIGPNELDFGKRAVAHELSHVVTRQESFNFYGDLPVWLNEGLAMWNEGPMRPEMVLALQAATEQKSFPSLRTLSSPFSGDIDEALLSYAVSQSAVQLLLDRYGASKMQEVLGTFKNGSSYDDAFVKVYGMDLDQLFELWRNSILSPDRRTVGDAVLIGI